MSAVEGLKVNSKFLRGNIAEEINSDAECFSAETTGLLKFHGTYQQDDRDLRVERRKQGLDRRFIMMVRSKIPGGQVTSKQYLAHVKITDELGNGSLRITSRQGFQTHGVLKGNLRECIRRINECGLTTWGACGDVVRNVTAAPSPLKDKVHLEVQRLCHEIKNHFSARTRAYSEIWLNGDKIELGNPEEDDEPIFGKAYLPRKFKIGIAVPPRNDIDVYCNDVGVVPIVAQNGDIEGYNIHVGGSMGMSHGKEATFPALAMPLCFIQPEHLMETLTAIVLVQRDYGDREDRKHARLKYLLADRGIEWFRHQVQERLNAEVRLEEVRPVEWTTVGDMLGWNEQGDGKLFCTIWVPEGRIKDYEREGQFKTCFKEIAERFDFPIRLTPNCNFMFFDIDPAQKQEVDQILTKYGITPGEHFTEARKVCQACVALPTCGLALAESERVFGGVMNEIDKVLADLHLEHEPLLIRMTGCPNGCARPYNADFGFVGRGPERYAFFVGGSSTGDRMAGLERHTVLLDDIPHVVREYLEEFVQNRLPGETFSHYWGRTHHNGEAPHPSQFHQEMSHLKAATIAGE